MTRHKKILDECLNFGILESYSLSFDIECGIHSGFKDCCIIFWLTRYIKDYACSAEYRRNFRKNPIQFSTIDEKYNKKLSRYENKNKFIGYVPCPECLKNKKFVKVKNCECWKKIIFSGYKKEFSIDYK